MFPSPSEIVLFSHAFRLARKGGSETPVDGHAWVRVGGREFGLLGLAEAEGEGNLAITALPDSAHR